jgi:hypothetical protein
MFVDWENGDFTLRQTSPAHPIRAGLTEAPLR